MSRACVTVARLTLAALIAIALPIRPTADGPQLASAYAKEAHTKRAPERPREFAPRISDVVNLVNIVIGTVLQELPGGAREDERPRSRESVVVAPLPDPDMPATEVRRRERRAAPEQVAFIPLPRPDGLGKVLEEESVRAAMVPPALLFAEARPRAYVRSLAPVSVPAPSHPRAVPRAVPAAPVAPDIGALRMLPPIPFAEDRETVGAGGSDTAPSLASASATLQPPVDLESVTATLAAPTGTTAAGVSAAVAETPSGGSAASSAAAVAAGTAGSEGAGATSSRGPAPSVRAPSVRMDLPAPLEDLAARLSGPGGAGQPRDLAAILVYGLAAVLATSLALRVARRPVSAARRGAAAERGRAVWRAAGNALAGTASRVSRRLAVAAGSVIGLAARVVSGVIRSLGRAAMAAMRVASHAAASVVALMILAGKGLSSAAVNVAAIIVLGARLAISLLWHGGLTAAGVARTRMIPALRRTISAAATAAGDRIIPSARSGVAAIGQAAATRLIPAARDGLGRGLGRAAGAMATVWPGRGTDRSIPAKPTVLRASAARKILSSEEDAVRAVRMAFDRLESQVGAKRAS